MSGDIPIMGERHLLPILTRLGQDVTVAGETTKGIVADVTEEVLEGLAEDVAVHSNSKFVVVKGETLSGIRHGAQLDTGGESFRIYYREDSPTGAVTRLLCMRLS